MNSSRVIKSYRGKSLKTQKELASELEVSIPTYASCENNPLNHSYDMTFKILCKLDIDELVFFDAIIQDFKSYKNNLKS